MRSLRVLICGSDDVATDLLTELAAEHWAALRLRFRPRNFTDQEALAPIIRVTGGNVRLLRLFTQIERLLRSNERRMVTSEVVTTAGSSVVIGAPA